MATASDRTPEVHAGTFLCEGKDCGTTFTASWTGLERVACPACRWSPRQAVLYARISPRPKVRTTCSRCHSKFVRKPNMTACPRCTMTLMPEKRPKGIEDSIRPQLEYGRRYCGLYNLQVVAEFWDRRRSGRAVRGRPEFRKAVRLARDIRGVLTAYSLSRFVRNNELACRLLRIVSADGADLATVSEKFDTSTPAGRAWFKIKSVFDELYREEGAARTSDVMRSYQAAGRRMSARPKLGWRVNPDDPASVIPDDSEQEAIARIEELRDRRPSEICRMLLAEGFKPRGKQWHEKTIAGVIARLGTTR
jgi:DNA invertase Pin-like site-specific DNA recombinase